MMIIGNHIHVEGGGASLIIILAEMLVGELGLIGKWAFLIGAWVAIFSSLLGVWQGVKPMIIPINQLSIPTQNFIAVIYMRYL